MIQLISKPISEMTIEELKQEREVHSWQANKSKRGAEALLKRLYWLEENKPIPTKEQIKKDHEEGQLTGGQYKTAYARRANAVNYRYGLALKAQYSQSVADEERATIAYIDERLIELEATAPKPKRGRPPKRDPRKRETPKKPAYKKPASHKSIEATWKAIEKSNKDNAKIREKLAPIPHWNTETLLLIGYDRGYHTERILLYHLSQKLELSLNATKEAYKSGKFTYGQVLIIGAFLEMTPREFCDVFLHDYFVDRWGEFRAEIENERALLDKPVSRDYKTAK